MMYLIFTLGFTLCLLPGLSAFQISKNYAIFSARSSRISIFLQAQSSDNTNVENGVSLSSLAEFPKEGEFLKNSIAKWLDGEYLPLDIHKELGDKVESVYVDCRTNGINDLGELMLTVGTELESVDMKDAFVNGWDVANKVSDLIMVLLKRELCCSGDLSEFINDSKKLNENMDTVPKFTIITGNKPIPLSDKDAKRLKQSMKNYGSEFTRFKLLHDFLEGDVKWQEMHDILLILLGFRIEGVSGDYQLKQDKNLWPINWEALDKFPDFSDLDEHELRIKMTDDLPVQEFATDIVMESVAGIENYEIMKNSENALIQRRILIAKWMYTQGFLNSDFPATKRYIPAHQAEEMEFN